MRIAALVSGGVDSSVALYHALKQRRRTGTAGRTGQAGRTRQAGTTGQTNSRRRDDITAYFLRVWSEDDLRFANACPWEDDLHYARLVCDKLGVPLEVISLQREYREAVIDHTLAELRRGRTPSPDVLCNSRIKFGAFLRALPDMDCVVSGHYARVTHGATASYLMRARDSRKDQTYFLSHLSPAQLRKLRTPLGEYGSKEHVRRIARRVGLPNAGRPDSQGLCFLGAVRYRDFIAHYLSRKAGDIIDAESGAVVGAHDGFWFYTVGQRRGLGLSGGPWYVLATDRDRNTVTVGRDRALLARRRFVIDDMTLNIPQYQERLRRGERLRCAVKIRHGPDTTKCALWRTEDGRYQVRTRAPVSALAAGQRAALYIRRYCIGGGSIALE